MPYSPSDQKTKNRLQALKEELKNHGWMSGVNIQFDERWTTDNMDLIRAAAANLVELKTDVIVATGGRVIPILMKTTNSIPIVVLAAPLRSKDAMRKVLPGPVVTSPDLPFPSSRSSARCYTRSRRLRQIFRMLPLSTIRITRVRRLPGRHLRKLPDRLQFSRPSLM